jgi:hypothetical protein
MPEELLQDWAAMLALYAGFLVWHAALMVGAVIAMRKGQAR